MHICIRILGLSHQNVYLHVHTCIFYTHARIYQCTYVYTHIVHIAQKSIHTYAYVYTPYAYVYIHMHIYINLLCLLHNKGYIHIHMCVLCFICMNIHIHAHIYKRIVSIAQKCMHTFTHCTKKDTYIYTCVYKNVYIHLHMCISYTREHTYTCTYVLVYRVYPIQIHTYIFTHVYILSVCAYIHMHICKSTSCLSHKNVYVYGEVGGWGRDPKKCTGRDWGMGSSTI